VVEVWGVQAGTCVYPPFTLINQHLFRTEEVTTLGKVW
jgi:hypothetical protein